MVLSESEWISRVTTSSLSPIAGSSIEQHEYKNFHWKERGLYTLVESSCFVPVGNVLTIHSQR